MVTPKGGSAALGALPRGIGLRTMMARTSNKAAQELRTPVVRLICPRLADLALHSTVT